MTIVQGVAPGPGLRGRHARGRRAAALLAGTVVLASLACTVETPVATKGRLPLSGWSFERDGSVPLTGEWEVCWGAFVSPATGTCPDGAWAPFPVPGLWSERGRDSPIGGRGIASYRLRIDLPGDAGPLTLRAGAPMTAYELWINGRARGGSGRPAQTAHQTQPRLENRSYEVPAADRLTLLVHVANFDFRGGGLRRTWTLGTREAIGAQVGRALLRDGGLASATLVIAILFGAQWAFRPGARAAGWFALCTGIIGLRAIAASVSDLSELVLPWASFELLLRLEYLGTALVLAAAPAFFRSKVEGVMPPRVTQMLQIAALALVPIVLLGSLRMVLATLPVMMLLGPLLFGIALTSYWRAYRSGLPGTVTTLTATALFLLAIGHDIVRVETGWGASIEIFPFFVGVWIVTESHALLQSHAHSYATIESLSDELQGLNLELQEAEDSVVRFVPFDLLRTLGRKTFRDIQPGDHTELDLPVLSCSVDIPARSPAEGFMLLEGLIESLSETLHAHEGLLVQQLGTELIACFPGGADDAVEAGLEIQRRLRERLAGQPGEPGFAIGIVTAPLVLGTAGSARQLLSLAIGPGLDAARAVRGPTRSGDTVLRIGEETRTQLSGAYLLRPGPDLELAGARRRTFDVLDQADGRPSGDL